MQRFNGHCYVIVALSDVKKYSLQRKSAVFLKLNISKSSGNFFVKMVAFCRDKNSFILHQKHENFRFPLHPPFKTVKKQELRIHAHDLKLQESYNHRHLCLSLVQNLTLHCYNSFPNLQCIHLLVFSLL